MTPHSSDIEKELRQQLLNLFNNSLIEKNELLDNLFVFTQRRHFTDFLSMNFLYNQILDVSGDIIELGCRWGQRLCQLIALRGIYEPYNFHRQIIGFDTFTGFPEISDNDGNHKLIAEGAFTCTKSYYEFLEKILTLQESDSPINHFKKFKLIKGDVNFTLESYLKENPEKIAALVYFDLDLYKPTKKCIELILSHAHKGSIFAFDELTHPNFPGEAIALKETLQLNKIKLMKVPLSNVSYFKFE
jgi:hypothetical protein